MIYIFVYRMFRDPAQPGEGDANGKESRVLPVAAPFEYSDLILIVAACRDLQSAVDATVRG